MAFAALSHWTMSLCTFQDTYDVTKLTLDVCTVPPANLGKEDIVVSRLKFIRPILQCPPKHGFLFVNGAGSLLYLCLYLTRLYVIMFITKIILMLIKNQNILEGFESARSF